MLSLLTPIPISLVLYQDNDQYIQWGPIIDGTTDGNTPPTYLNSLSGTLDLVDPTGADDPGATGNSFVYDAASNGIYQALIPQSAVASIATGPGYTVEIDFSGTIGHGHWEVPAWLKIRKS